MRYCLWALALYGCAHEEPPRPPPPPAEWAQRSATPSADHQRAADSAALAAIVAAGPPPGPQITIEDQRRPLTGSVEDALRQHAAALIPCPIEQVKARELTLGRAHNPSEYTFAEGCGQRVVYSSRPSVVPPQFYVLSRFSLGALQR